MPDEAKKTPEVPTYYSNRLEASASNVDVCLTFFTNVPPPAATEGKREPEFAPQARIYVSLDFFQHIRKLIDNIAEESLKARSKPE